MITSLRCRPTNSLLLVVAAETPQILQLAGTAGEPVAATSTCVVIGTRNEADGEVEVTFTDEYVEPDGLTRLYSGTLEAAELHVALQTVEGTQLAELTLPARQAAISVYGNEAAEPDRVVVQIA